MSIKHKPRNSVVFSSKMQGTEKAEEIIAGGENAESAT